MTYASIPTAQIVDYLYKKVGYGVAKTDANSRPAASEGNASPFLTLGSALYQLDYAIPKYSSFAAMITGGNIVTTANPTTGLPGGLTISTVATVQASAIAGSTTGATWQTNLYNWIPVPVGGQGYQVGVFAGPAGLAISSLQGSGANPNGPPGTVAVPINGVANDSWYFDYQSGILNFPDQIVPTTVSNVSNVIYITGAVYSGYTGITNWANLSVTGNINSTSGNINLTNGNIYAQNYFGTFQGTFGGGTSIALANVANYEVMTPVSTSSNIFYPKLSNIVAAGNSITGVSTSLSFVPSTGTLTATAFSGTLSATNVSGTVATANASIYTGVTNTASGTYYPVLSAQSTTGNAQAAASSSLSYNAATGALTATSFAGYGGALTGTMSTANASIYTGVTNTNTGTYYPLLSAQNTTGNAQAAANSSLSYNAATGALTATSFSGYGGALTGTMSTANVALYEQITNLTNNQTYYLGFANVVTGNSTLGAVTSVNVNPSTGQVNSVSANVTTLNVGSTSILAGQVQITNAAASTTYGSGALVVAGGLGVAGAAFFNSNVSIAGNLVVTGNNISLGATSLSITDPIINLNTPQDLTPLTVPTTNDIGLKFHYYDTADSAGFAGRTVVDGYFTYWAKGTDTANVFTGTVLGTVKGGGLIVANARVVAGGLSDRTGSMQVWGDASITGNLYVGNGLQNTPIGTLGSSTGNFTTVTAQTVNAATIGNSGASIVGTISATGVSGTVTTANAAIYTGITNTATGTYYPVLSAQNTTGNAQAAASNSLSYNAATGALTATSFSGTVSATNVSGTVATANAAIYTGITNTATGTYYPVLSAQNTTGNAQAAAASSLSFNAATGALTATSFAGYGGALTGTMSTANVALYEQVQNYTTGTFYPTFSNTSTSTGNTTIGVNSSLTYNAATGALTATSFSGTLSATNVSGTVATANVALYEQVQNYTTGTFYPTFSNTSTSTGNTTIGVNSSLTYNAATGALTATSFSGYGGALTGTMATANASIYTGVTNTNTGTYYPVLSAQNTTGNAQSAVNSSLSYNAATGALTATSFSGTVGATNVSGTVATANVALYEQVNNWTTGTFYPTFSNTSTTAGNTVIGVNSSLSYNAATGALTATSFSGTLSATNLNGTAATANVSLYDSVTAYTTNQTFYPVFSNTSSSGNTVAGVATNLSFNPSSGTLSATVLSGTVTALNVSGTVATANVALYASATPYTTNQTFYPVFSNVSAAGNTTVGVNSGLSYNPSTGTLTATNFAGAMSGTIGTANVALYEQVTALTTNQTFYPMFSNINAAGNTISGVATNLSFNPATGLLTTTTFSGAGTLTTLSTSGVASLGANVVINNGSNTNDNVSGGLVIKGTAGAAIGGNINVGSAMFIGSGAQSTVLNSPIAIKRGTPGVAPGFQYLQDALISATNYGSSDFIAYGNNYTGVSSDHGFMDMGFTGDAFTDPYYSLTKSNDGYVFASGANATVGGNLVIATDYTGSYNDIVLGVGSFYANSEVARFHGNTSNSGTFVLKLPTNASPAANTGAFQVWGGASFAGNTYHGGATVFNGSQTAGQDFVVRGRNDATLIWARPNATYDSVIIGNSATASTAVNGAKLVINTNDSIMLPVGSNAQRPTASGLGTDTAGMFRYSSTSSSVEWYNGTSWQSASISFTVIVDQQFTGTNSQTAFTLSQTATTAGVIVSINGVLQIPTLAYSVSGTTLTFTEAPLTTDVIDVRLLTTTSTVTSISSATGKAQVLVDDTTGIYFQSSNTPGTTVFSMPIGGGIVSNDANVSVASANTLTTLDTVPNGTYRSAKYIIQVTNGTNFQAMEALMVQNGTTATITTYGVVQTNGNLGILSATVSSSNTLVQFVAANASNQVRVYRQYLPL
jgi:hypothetical protein